ncbi:tripartite tricarboxylate transporter TctB family protein [Sulfitobacter sp. S190]|uniref:tripartite tricarboxylate transporter TctB family protein n=1 Tax=Sulfitobacter sp. S190 TaxID=2867022 RepID=UPI0021A7335F|nr:tripartite tricarboxylate transporter TctB family protein [Sulfitobacter sp. S190]UWR21166.1 tripartite tricarboxylate transporter TctB family protein [Sulfitobacter sp. S190]
MTVTPEPAPAARAVGTALILTGIGATAASLSIGLDQYGRWGARYFPLAASASLLVLGVIELRASAKDRRLDRSHLAAIAGLLALSVAYVWTISAFGYLIATALAAPLALLLFGVRSVAGLCAASVLCPLAYHLVFFVGLGVFPPLGRWFDLLDLIGGY